jgi:hypothetical protein
MGIKPVSYRAALYRTDQVFKSSCSSRFGCVTNPAAQVTEAKVLKEAPRIDLGTAELYVKHDASLRWA